MSLDLRNICRLRTALGEPNARAALADSAKESLEVFRLRGSEQDVFSHELSSDGIETALQTDFSLTSSRANLDAVFDSLAIGNIGLASEISSLAWDPPDAAYIGPRSTVCRHYDCVLASSVAMLLQGDVESSMSVLGDLRIPEREERPRFLKEGLEAICEGSGIAILQSIEGLIEWHQKASSVREPYEFISMTDYYLCFWAIGLTNWALTRRMIELSQVPKNCPSLPIDWIEHK